MQTWLIAERIDINVSIVILMDFVVLSFFDFQFKFFFYL